MFKHAVRNDIQSLKLIELPHQREQELASPNSTIAYGLDSYSLLDPDREELVLSSSHESEETILYEPQPAADPQVSGRPRRNIRKSARYRHEGAV